MNKQTDDDYVNGWSAYQTGTKREEVSDASPAFLKGFSDAERDYFEPDPSADINSLKRLATIQM